MGPFETIDLNAPEGVAGRGDPARRHGADGHRAPDARSGELRRRRTVPRPGTAQEGQDVGDSRSPRQRRDDQLLCSDPGRVRPGNRLRRSGDRSGQLGSNPPQGHQHLGPRMGLAEGDEGTAGGGGMTMLDKRMTPAEIVGQLSDGMTLGIGGWGPRRKPMALVR